MSALEQTLLRLARTLSDNDIPYMIIGGIANVVWGKPRATLDIDATVWVTDDEIGEVISLLQNVFQPLVSNPSQFISDTRVLPLESEEGVRIDLIFGMMPYEQEAIDRAVELTIAGFQIRFCTPEDLILHKIVSEREKDLEDARGVTLRQIKSLDLAYLDSRIGELADALECPDIWHSWEKWKKEAKGKDSTG